MNFVSLDDPTFLNFNFHYGWDPTLRPGAGPGVRALYKMVMEGRRDPLKEGLEFAQVMGWTPRPEAFESFERVYGAAVAFRDWFYSKLYQYFRLLLYERVEVLGNAPDGRWGPPKTDKPWEEGFQQLEGFGEEIHPDLLERAFDPSKCGTYRWNDVVLSCLQAEASERLEVALEFVREHLPQRAQPRRLDEEQGRRPCGSQVPHERDRFIAGQLIQGASRERICELLDKRRFPATLNMLKNGISSWAEAFRDQQFRRDVQSIFSKALKRFSAPI
jgi:hypothetical protein